MHVHCYRDSKGPKIRGNDLSLVLHGMEKHATSWVTDNLDAVLFLDILMMSTNTSEGQSLLGIFNLLLVRSNGVGAIASVVMLHSLPMHS